VKRNQPLQLSRTFARSAFGALCLLLTGAYAARIVYELYQNVACVRVPATVKAVSVESRKNRHGSLSYRPVISFAYTLNGVEYESARYNANGAFWAAEEKAERLVGPYHAGQQVTAFVLRSAPDAAFLKREVAWQNFVAVFLLIAIWVILRRTVYSNQSLGISEEASTSR